MLDDLERVVASLRFLELRPDINEYKWRFLIQKTTYLTQALGINTNYYFTIYVAGPYSPMLTADYYAHADRVSALETSYELTSNDILCLEKIRECNDLYEKLSLMEAASTVVYLMKQNPRLMDRDIFAMTKTLKPHLSDPIIVIGACRAKKLLFRPEYLTEELKKEAEQWDNIESQ